MIDPDTKGLSLHLSGIAGTIESGSKNFSEAEAKPKESEYSKFSCIQVAPVSKVRLRKDESRYPRLTAE
jgi:hypothetical protein